MKKERNLISGFKEDYFKSLNTRLALTSIAIIKARTQWIDKLNMLKENSSPLRVQYPGKKFQNKDERKTSSDKGKLQKVSQSS